METYRAKAIYRNLRESDKLPNNFVFIGHAIEGQEIEVIERLKKKFPGVEFGSGDSRVDIQGTRVSREVVLYDATVDLPL